MIVVYIALGIVVGVLLIDLLCFIIEWILG
jgi:hypothetical protein